MIEDIGTHHIGIIYIRIFIGMAQSLKQKRMIVKGVKEKIRNKFNVSVAEIDSYDKWQIAVLGICMIGNDNRYIDSCLQNIITFIEKYPEIEISDYKIEFL